MTPNDKVHKANNHTVMVKMKKINHTNSRFNSHSIAKASTEKSPIYKWLTNTFD